MQHIRPIHSVLLKLHTQNAVNNFRIRSFVPNEKLLSRMKKKKGRHARLKNTYSDNSTFSYKVSNTSSWFVIRIVLQKGTDGCCIYEPRIDSYTRVQSVSIRYSQQIIKKVFVNLRQILVELFRRDKTSPRRRLTHHFIQTHQPN